MNVCVSPVHMFHDWLTGHPSPALLFHLMLSSFKAEGKETVASFRLFFKKILGEVF